MRSDMSIGHWIVFDSANPRMVASCASERLPYRPVRLSFPACHATSLSSRLGLGRPELRAWAMYDWATSAVQTTIMVAVFPIYFVKVAGAGAAGRRCHPAARDGQYDRARHHRAALARARRHLRLSGERKSGCWPFSCGIGVAACGGMFFDRTGETLTWLRCSSSLALIGAAGSFVFYEALLPHIAAPDEIDRVSTAGYAMGYVGGGLLLALNLAWIQKPAWFGLPSGSGLERERKPRCRRGSRSSRWRSGGCCSRSRSSGECRSRRRGLEPDERPGESPIKMAFVRLAETFRELRELPPGVPDAVRLPDLQRRDPDHHQDGHGLRDRDRYRPERAHRRDSAGAVRGNPLHLSLRDAGRTNRRQARASSSACWPTRRSASWATS